MKINLLAFGIAKDILGKQSAEINSDSIRTVGELKEHLVSSYQGFGKLRSLSFAVNTEYVDDSYHLGDGDEVVIIPPVSGG